MNKNLEFVKESFKIMLKILVEYKINFFNVLLVQVFFLGSNFFLFYVLSINFGEEIGWTFQELIIYILIIDLLWQLLGSFIWGPNGGISNSIINGSFNTYLFRPLSTKLQYYSTQLSSVSFMYLVSTILIIPVIITYFKIDLYFTINLLIYFLLSLSFIFFFHESITSFGFLMKKLDQIISSTIWQPIQLMTQYPYPFFKKFPIQKLLYLIPYVFVATLIIPELFQKESIYNTSVHLIILIILNIFFATIYFFNWHYGLKKYEAYG